MRRFLLELVIFVLLGALAFAVFEWQDRRQQRDLAEQAATQQALTADLRGKSEFWAETLAASEAEAVFRAFAAGISPAVLSGREGSIDLAAVALLKLRGIDFVHLLNGQGEVLYSSDAKMTVGDGDADDLAWALATTELTTRAGPTRGVTEVAAPIQGPDGPAAYLWIGYRTESILDETRPTTLAR